MAFAGCCAPERDGRTSRRAMDRTRPATIASCAGSEMAPGSGSSRPCKPGKKPRAGLTERSRSTAASSVRISMRQKRRSRQQKGGASSTGRGPGTQPRRLQHQAPCKRRRQRAPALDRPHGGAAAREHAGRAGARAHCGAPAHGPHPQAPEAAPGGSGVQLPEDPPPSARSQDPACHPPAQGLEGGTQSQGIGGRTAAGLRSRGLSAQKCG